MLQLILMVLLNLGFKIDSAHHITMNSYNANEIKSNRDYISSGGDYEFNTYVSVDDKLVDDIVITDDDNPVHQN
jgi:hypothetical protein